MTCSIAQTTLFVLLGLKTFLIIDSVTTIDTLSQYDPNFACCGGCSSSKRADAYNNKLARGSRIFIWDIKLKSNPAPVCVKSFPYDPSLNEQQGERRVRSGRLVGTSYPLDHDYDQLCCEQRGQCILSEEDATGKCKCVKQWGYTGDHCEYSIYDVAALNNTALVPTIGNFSQVRRFLPDPRYYVSDFNYATAFSSAVDSYPSHDIFLNALQEPDSYDRFGWMMMAPFLIIGFFVLVTVICQLICLCCCCCRGKDARKRKRIYSKRVKILWGTFMFAFSLIALCAAVFTLILVQHQLIPRQTAIAELLTNTLPTQIKDFEAGLRTPLDDLLDGNEKNPSHLVSILQDDVVKNMEEHTFLDQQTMGNDVIGEPIFTILHELTNLSTLFPTAMDGNPITCIQRNITSSITSRMTNGAISGCFRCKLCSLLSHIVDQENDRWERHAFQFQLDMQVARRQLQAFGNDQTHLEPALQQFRARLVSSTGVLLHQLNQLKDAYDMISGQTYLVTWYGIIGLSGMAGVVWVLGIIAFTVGLLTNRRLIARTTCCMTEFSSLLAILMTGILYSIALLSYDGIQTLQLIHNNSSILVNRSSTIAANDIEAMLMDRSIIQYANMRTLLDFSDTLRVPPHPNPIEDDIHKPTPRVNLSEIYNLPDLFDVEKQVKDVDTARIQWFGWEPTFLQDQYALLYLYAFANNTIISPYNQTIYYTILQSTPVALMDPDNDGHYVTDDDRMKIQTVFNDSWRGVGDRGVAQNDLIATQWLFVAQLEYQKQRLSEYFVNVSTTINRTRPLLMTAQNKAAALEHALYQLKAPIEVVTGKLRLSKINDCSFDANCAWFREALNELFDLFQGIIVHAEVATITCAVGVLALLLGAICSGCFASRLRRNVVKVYAGVAYDGPLKE